MQIKPDEGRRKAFFLSVPDNVSPCSVELSEMLSQDTKSAAETSGYREMSWSVENSIMTV